MLISIIIPIYNVSQYLRKCLDSCLSQTYEDLEIICVDDGSTDNSGEIVDEYAAKDSRFKAIHKPNGGLPSARKAGIEAATGDYIFHLDGDDNLPFDTIASLVGVVRSDNSDIVIGDYYSYELDGKQYYRDSRINQQISGKQYLEFILTEGLFNIWGKLIRRSLYEDNPIQIPLNISMGEDLVAMTQLAYYSEIVSVCKEPCYNYYVRPTSMSIVDKQGIGSLTDRSIYAVDFITRFLSRRANKNTVELLRDYVTNFVYTYFRSDHPVSLRRNELLTLVRFLEQQKNGKRSFAIFICSVAAINMTAAKFMAQVRNLVSRE